LPTVTDIELLVQAIAPDLQAGGLIAAGESFVVVYGAPLGSGHATNTVRVEACS
jgi:hypothetical protein